MRSKWIQARSQRATATRLLSALSLFLCLCCLSALARAQETSASEGHEPLLPFRMDGHASFDWESNFGLGLRADIPIMDKSRMYNSRDELAISVGADLMFVTFGGSNRLFVWPTATVQWSLAVSDDFTFYPELGLAAKFERDGWDGVFPNVGFGGRYYVSRSVALLGRLGWPMALSAGVVF